MIPVRSWFVVPAIGALAILAACESAPLAAPSIEAPGSASFARPADRGPSCEITLPAPVNRDLPAVREVTRELNEAFAKPTSSVNCGVINGIGQRMNTLVSMLDRASEDQNLNAACGIATGLTNQLRALEAGGQLDPIVTHPPVAGPNVVDNMDHIRGQFCMNAER